MKIIGIQDFIKRTLKMALKVINLSLADIFNERCDIIHEALKDITAQDAFYQMLTPVSLFD